VSTADDPVQDSHAFPASPLRWVALGLAAMAIFATYYESDVIGELADLLGRQRGFTQAQIGNLNAAMYWPSVLLALFGGMLIDRFGAARMACWTAAVGVVGAVLTAVGEPYSVMWTGRFLFGICEGAIFMALITGLALWFPRSGIALATALFLSLARVGSFMCNRSTIWAKPLYDAGWQPPLWLGAAITGAGFVAACLLYLLDRRRTSVTAAERGHRLPKLRELLQFDASFWYILGLHVLYASVFFPFRQTYAVEYLQHAKHLTLQEAASVNSGVFFAAIFATPLFGFLADRFGRRALFLCFGTLLLPVTLLVLGLTDWNPWVSTVLMGISWALVPAIIWPSTTLIVEPARLGTALGVITLIQALGILGSNLAAGALADAAHASAEHPAGYSVMLLFFGAVSLLALTSVVLLWRRERGPHGHGLEDAGLSRRAA
jgi:MFS family permease